MIIRGQLIDVEYVDAYADPKTGEVKRRPYPRLHILDGREVQRVNMAADYLANIRLGAPEKPTEIEVEVRVRAYSGRSGPALAIDYLSGGEQALRPPQTASAKAA